MINKFTATALHTGVAVRVSYSEQADSFLVHAMRPATDGYMQASDMWLMQVLS